MSIYESLLYYLLKEQSEGRGDEGRKKIRIDELGEVVKTAEVQEMEKIKWKDQFLMRTL